MLLKNFLFYNFDLKKYRRDFSVRMTNVFEIRDWDWVLGELI
jgi:hypothetical protein